MNQLEFLSGKYKEYSYILGVYLGDGCIDRYPRTFKMRIFLDKKYQELNNLVIDSLKFIFPKNKVSVLNHINHLTISVYNKNMDILFPHLGNGKKHNRKIVLLEWQNRIIDPIQTLKGLFHSDGCYYTEYVNGYKYERFDFTNKSSDIQKIFCNYCDDIGISYKTRLSKTGLIKTRICKKKDVLKFKNIIGTKQIVLK